MNPGHRASLDEVGLVVIVTGSEGHGHHANSIAKCMVALPNHDRLDLVFGWSVLVFLDRVVLLLVDSEKRSIMGKHHVHVIPNVIVDVLLVLNFFLLALSCDEDFLHGLLI